MQTDTEREGQDVLQKAEQTASTFVQQAQQTATAQLSSQKGRTADTLATIAGTLRESGQNLRDDQPQIASLTDQAAQRVEDVSSYIREHDVRELVGQAESFARREPAIFLGGCFAAGFLAARFLKASSPTEGGARSVRSTGTDSVNESYRWNPDTGFGSSPANGGSASTRDTDAGSTRFAGVGAARYSGSAEEPAATSTLDTSPAPGATPSESGDAVGGDSSTQQDFDDADVSGSR